MKESIQTYFRLGILQWMSYPRQEGMQALKTICNDDFFEVIETKGYGTENEKAAELLKQSHLGVCFGSHPRILGEGLNPNDTDEAARLRAETALLEMLEEAQVPNAEGIAFLSGKWNPERKEEAFSQLLKTTKTLCAKAKEKNMMVELEVFDYDVDKCALIGPAPLAARFAAAVREEYENFGLIVDLSHIPITHEKSAEVIHTLKPYITHFHYGNAVLTPGCDAYGDKHPRFGYPNGVNDTKELMEFLRAIRDEGFCRADKPVILSMEVSPRPHEDEQTVVVSTKRTLLRAWAQLEE